MILYYKQGKKNKGENHRVGRSMMFGGKLTLDFICKGKNIQRKTSFMEVMCSQITEFMQRKFRNA